jgi:hypothetical protein
VVLGVSLNPVFGIAGSVEEAVVIALLFYRRFYPTA